MRITDLHSGSAIILKPKKECVETTLSIPYIGVFDDKIHIVERIALNDNCFKVRGDDYWYHIDWVKLIVTDDVESELII